MSITYPNALPPLFERATLVEHDLADGGAVVLSNRPRANPLAAPGASIRSSEKVRPARLGGLLIRGKGMR